MLEYYINIYGKGPYVSDGVICGPACLSMEAAIDELAVAIDEGTVTHYLHTVYAMYGSCWTGEITDLSDEAYAIVAEWRAERADEGHQKANYEARTL